MPVTAQRWLVCEYCLETGLDLHSTPSSWDRGTPGPASAAVTTTKDKLPLYELPDQSACLSFVVPGSPARASKEVGKVNF